MRSRFYQVVVWLFWLSATASGGSPQVAFTQDGGWIRFRLTHDTRPMPGAAVSVFDSSGFRLAEGETGGDGQGAFPAASCVRFLVEVRFETWQADPVPLECGPGGVFPDAVQLTRGVQPCCQSGVPVPVRHRPTPTVPGAEFPSALWVALAVSALVFAASVALVWKAFPDPISTDSSKEQS